MYPEVTRSNDPSGNCRSRASPTCQSILTGRSSSDSFLSASSSILGVMSTPTTVDPSPAVLATWKAISPVPVPTSRHLLPRMSPAFLIMNLCQPCTMCMLMISFISS